MKVVKLGFLSMAILIFVATAALAENAVRIGVLPFAIHSQEDLGYLSQGIQEMLNTHLSKGGVEIVEPSAVARAHSGSGAGMDEGTARKLARKLKADYIVFGSLTKVGQSVSLDARVVDAKGAKRTGSAFIQDQGLDNLSVTTEKLAQEIQAGLSGFGGHRIARITIQGNDRVEVDAILGVVQSQEGKSFSEAEVSADLRRIYGMGLFDDVRVEVRDAAGGKEVIFWVEEKPHIKDIEFAGNRVVEREELVDIIGYTAFSVVEPKKIAASLEQIKNYYREKGYYNAEVAYEIKNLDAKKVVVSYKIKEGKRLYIRNIEFVGNQAFTDRKLRRQMETSTKGFLSFITDSGILKQSDLKNDLDKVESFYRNHGYIKAKVGHPEIKVQTDHLVLAIPVEEGPQFKVGKITLGGDLIIPEETLFKAMKLKEGDIYNREVLRKDVQQMMTMYADKGYAYVEVIPGIHENTDSLTADIDYKIDKNLLVHFERITISGNTTTRDKVIRRQIKVKEGDQFSAKKLRNSNLRLQTLRYFKDVKMVTTEGSSPDKMNLKVEVEEAPTASFAVGLGYSSYNKAFGTASISENNLFGRGQQLKLEATMGGSSNEYLLSFTEPWLFDMPLLFGVEIFQSQTEYTDYDKESSGIAIRAGYPIYKSFRLSGRYKWEDIDVTNVDDDASTIIKEIKGESSTSSLVGVLSRDTRDKVVNTQKGSQTALSIEYAGGFLGGNQLLHPVRT